MINAQFMEYLRYIRLFIIIVISFIVVNTDGSDCNLMEAEKRELQLNKYVQDLVKLPQKVGPKWITCDIYHPCGKHPANDVSSTSPLTYTVFMLPHISRNYTHVWNFKLMVY